jgi:4-alpha-glucanotransferase
MKFPRSSGVLLHLTSLPGRFGIGDLGPEAYRFVEFLAETGQGWWQFLPLGPTGRGSSPYESPSAFGGNPLLISLEAMAEKGWLDPRELPGDLHLGGQKADFAAAAAIKHKLLEQAFERFRFTDPDFVKFTQTNAYWLDDYALFEAIKEATGGKPWFRWVPGLAKRDPATLARWREKLASRVRYHQFLQFVFDTQMQAFREACLLKNIHLMGDIPIFVAHDSADVWAHPDLFYMDKQGGMTYQAGVPPDLFSRTGQLWRNPLYRWEAHQKEGFSWWFGRLSKLWKWVSAIRIDHFRGFEAYWEVPGRAKTAANGRWVKAPGVAFFKALQKRFVDLPLVAEDLGVITPEVDALRDQFSLPGMRVLQFGFSTTPSEEKFLPHRFVSHCVVYTGTHDNDTSVGWLTTTQAQTTQSADEIKAERSYALRYVGTSGKEFHWDMIRLALGSVADLAIIPMQDLLGLDTSARMNVPGTPEGNWAWRFETSQLTPEVKGRLAELTAIFARWNGPIPSQLDPHYVAGRAPTPEATKPAKKTGRTVVSGKSKRGKPS